MNSNLYSISSRNLIFLEGEYVSADTVNITFPDRKRNLIYIFVESGESSLQSINEGGLFDENYIPELTKLAKDNVSFSQSNRVAGAAVAPACGWTAAGIVAESAGVPLKLFTFDENMVDNSMGKYDEFLPGVKSLGDILEENGYANYFMCGSDIIFGGRDKYFAQHGNYKCFDYYYAMEDDYISKDYKVWWGMEDKKLFDSAKEPAKEKYRMFTTLDMFPTTLAAMGAEIECERLGLGTNLFSDMDTLSEKYGYETEFEEISKKSKFYNKELLYVQE